MLDRSFLQVIGRVALGIVGIFLAFTVLNRLSAGSQKPSSLSVGDQSDSAATDPTQGLSASDGEGPRLGANASLPGSFAASFRDIPL
jgi:hypothetical protein